MLVGHRAVLKVLIVLLVLLQPSTPSGSCTEQDENHGWSRKGPTIIQVEDQVRGERRRLMVDIRELDDVVKAVLSAFPQANRDSVDVDCGGKGQDSSGSRPVLRVCIKSSGWESSFLELRKTVCDGWRRMALMPSTAGSEEEYRSGMKAGALMEGGVSRQKPCVQREGCVLGAPVTSSGGEEITLHPIEGGLKPGSTTDDAVVCRPPDEEVDTARQQNQSLQLTYMSWGPRHVVQPGNVSVQLVSLFPKQEVVQRSWGSCAVVASGWKLKGSHLGHVIDSHDSVIRFNLAIVKGAEKDVGTRTTHRMLHRYAANSVLRRDDITYMLTPDDGSSLQLYKQYRIVHGPRALWLSAEWSAQVGELLGKCVEWARPSGVPIYPSTGLYGLAAAVRMCDTVSAFGFGGPVPGARMHYFKNEQLEPLCKNASHGNHLATQEEYTALKCATNKTSGLGYPVGSNTYYNGGTFHDFRCEREVLADLRKLGLVEFF